MIYFLHLLILGCCLTIGITFLLMGFQKDTKGIEDNGGFDEFSFIIIVIYGLLKLFHVKQKEKCLIISSIITGFILTIASLGLILYMLITKKAIF
ncbi:hypothetical protein DY124_07050 [Apilactobacillus micheneri]|uniref:hypothetical protein n=1 Tax=Apilactobacillus micheneri TaxID=1899430 RepID=UPI001129E5CF|nr:hypothetical protein [Apilactobacillus micheneri]TPR42818.1 hypothetical protein DY124_07050 [Apilactobacillus micheneri]TPR47143.1 hypothetical protein DY125_06985 [Apilactobacillus micheneri]